MDDMISCSSSSSSPSSSSSSSMSQSSQSHSSSLFQNARNASWSISFAEFLL